MFDFYDATIIITALTIIIMFVDILSNKVITKDSKKQMLTACGLILVASICEWAGVRLNGKDSSTIWLHYTVKVIEFSTTPFISLIAAKAYGKVRFFTPCLIFAATNIVLQIISVLTGGWIFTIDEANLYHRMGMYWIYIVYFALSIVYFIYSILSGSRQYRFRLDATLISALVLIIAGITIQMIESAIRVDFLAIAIGNVVLYVRYGNIVMRQDALTKLFSRRCYEIYLRSIPQNSVIIFFDVNNFKEVNDKYGHTAGDECLAKIAQIINSVYARYGSCFRIGGDEFCVIITKNTQVLTQLNENFYNSIKSLQSVDERIPTVALGYTTFEKSDTNIDAVVTRADEAMYLTKSLQKQSENK
ncbi:MAG: diguanylate cyclase domain-containing protein [Candidatus Coproplasma sp.]